MGWFFDRFANNQNLGSAASELRRRRFALFRSIVESLPPPVTILDVGGTQGFWRSMGWSADPRYQITLLNLAPERTTQPGMRFIQGDATQLDQLELGSFDVVFSNSVIEHLGSLSAQERMARGVRKLGTAYFVQTPNKYFPLEPHFLVPLFQFLPVPVRVWSIRRFDLGWYRKRPDPGEARALVLEHRLLSHSEVRQLFPDAVIHRERFLGATKSFIAIRRP